MVGIKSIYAHFESSKLRLQDLDEYTLLENAEREYFDETGIESFYAATQVSAFDLAATATRKLLLKSGVPAAEIDLVIYIRTRLPELLIASEAAHLQYAIGASKAMAFSISDLGCTDMSMAIKIAYDFLTANYKAENVLIAHGCKPFSPGRLRYPVTVTGDGGLALLVSRTEVNQLLDFRFDTQGKYWDLFKMSYNDRTFKDYKEECSDLRKYGFELALESKMRFLELNASLLDDNGLSKKDIRHYILQNVSSRAYEFYETAFGIKISPVCAYNLAQYGHLGPNDVMINYLTGIHNGTFVSGDKVLIMNNSPVAAWSSILIQC